VNIQRLPVSRGLLVNGYRDRDRVLASIQVRDGIAMSRSASSTRVTRADPTDEFWVAQPRALQKAETRAPCASSGEFGVKGQTKEILQRVSGREIA
jgi:hypothetical protein